VDICSVPLQKSPIEAGTVTTALGLIVLNQAIKKKSSKKSYAVLKLCVSFTTHSISILGFHKYLYRRQRVFMTTQVKST